MAIMASVAVTRRRVTIFSLRLLVHRIYNSHRSDGPKHLVSYFIPLGHGKIQIGYTSDLLSALGAARTILTREQTSRGC